MMETTMKLARFTIPVEYAVYSTRDVFHPDNSTLADVLTSKEPARRHRALLVVDSGVADTRPPSWRCDVAAYFAGHGVVLVDMVVIPGGEACKNDPAVLDGLVATMNDHGLDRQSFVVIVGGGAVLDVAGFAAAIAHRGLRAVRIPTTVLAQGDSGVGVKNGRNAFGKKNALGTFAPPFAVINDARFLETLGRRDVIAGMAEAVKVALVRDRLLFAWMRAHAASLAERDPAVVAELVRRSAELHLAHIATSGDPFEQGSARPLDFGHWAAHKLESMTAHRLRHGEAVAIGIAIDALYSWLSGLCGEDVPAAVLALLERLGLRLWDDALDERAPDGRLRLLAGLEEFREHLGGELTVTMLRGIGDGCEIHALDEPGLLEAFARLRARAVRAGAA
jgi:3-dehydroquinate synthase